MGYGIILGGGAPSNFGYVVASSYASLPSSPSVNTFGLITATAVPAGGFSIRAKVPSSGMNAGDVVIITHRDSTKAFETVAGSGVYAYPASAYQYVGGLWVSIEAYIYQASAWGILWLYYFKDGSFSFVTGVTAAGDGTTSLPGTSIRLYLYNSTAAARKTSWGLDAQVNLSNYTEVVIKWSATTEDAMYVRFYICATLTQVTSTSSWPSAEVANDILTGQNGSYSGTATMNVASLEGLHVIHCGARSQAINARTLNLYVTEIFVR